MFAGCTAGPIFLLAQAIDGRIVRRAIISSCQSAVTSEIVQTYRFSLITLATLNVFFTLFGTYYSDDTLY